MDTSAMPRIVDISIRGIRPFRLAVDDENDCVIAPYLARHNLWEPCQTELVTRLIKPGQTVIDAGAHVGYFSVLFSTLVGTTGAAYAFEPEPVNHALLLQNLDMNEAGNVRPEYVALADRTGEETLYLSQGNGGDHQLFPSSGRNTCLVATTTLDRYLGEANVPVHFAKIDVQGVEPRVLAGMEETIKANRERLICLMEFDPVRLRLANGSVQALLDRLAGLDARIDWVDLQDNRVEITSLPDINGLKSVAKQLSIRGTDGSVLVHFSATSRRATLARLQHSSGR